MTDSVLKHVLLANKVVGETKIFVDGFSDLIDSVRKFAEKATGLVDEGVNAESIDTRTAELICPSCQQ